MTPASRQASRSRKEVAILAQSGNLIAAVMRTVGADAVRLCETLRELEQVARTTLAAVVYEFPGDLASNARDVAPVLAALPCPVVVLPRYQFGDGRALFEICRWRQDVRLPISDDDLSLMIAELIAGRQRADVVARIIAAVKEPLPGRLDDFRVFSAILAQTHSTPTAVARRCRRTRGAVATAARQAGVPSPRAQYSWHRSLIAISDVLESGLPEKQVAPNRGFGSASNLSHQVTTRTGQTIHDWKLTGGVDGVLSAYATLFEDRSKARGA